MNWGSVPEAPLLAEELVAVDSFQGRIFFFFFEEWDHCYVPVKKTGSINWTQ